MNRTRQYRRTLALACASFVCSAAASAAFAGNPAGSGYGSWGDPQYVVPVNTAAAAEGCPIESPDGRELYIASNRSAT